MSRKPPPRGLILKAGSQTSLSVAEPLVSARNSLLQANTIRGYVRDWMDFFKVSDISKVSTKFCLSVTPEDVAEFRDELIAKKLSPGTISRKLTALRYVFDYLIQRGLTSLNPAHPKLVRGPKRGQAKKMEWLSPEELKLLFRQIDRTTVLGRRDYALIMTELHMGLRREEVVKMRVELFKDAGGEAYYLFRSKGEKERKITVNRTLEEALAAYAADRGNEPGWLFPGRNPSKSINADYYWSIMQKYLKAAGIKKKVGTHGLRATFITVNLEKGTPLPDIQKTVGHSRGETTLGYARDWEEIKI